MLNIGIETKKIISYSKNLLLPSVVMGVFFLYFFSISAYTDSVYQCFHTLFISTVMIGLLVSVYFKLVSSVINLFLIYMSYIIINGMRYAYGEDYIFSSGYNVWTILVLPNLFLINVLCKSAKIRKNWSLLFVFLFFETALLEYLQRLGTDADSVYFYKHIGMLNYPAFYVDIICILLLFIKYIVKGRILTIKTLFTSIALTTAIYYSGNLLAFSLFFFLSVLIECLVTVYYIHYVLYKDEKLNIPTCNKYIKDVVEEKLPPKYSVSVLYIDEYNRLEKRFGERKALLLKKMFVKSIQKTNKDVLIYNYQSDALILVFANINTKACFEKAEEIRRAIATSIFIFNEGNHLQITISQCVSEARRSDADAMTVVLRAEKNLQKACKFTRNITVKA
ncbi:MAG: diguanylate cyclase [Alphaproteobacteria bacterium]|nr:diguanylate cyclase [Alphaproteobacteria bacterium]